MVMELILESLGLAVDKITITTKTWLRWLLWSLAAALILFGIGWASATTFLLKAGIILLLVIVTGIVAVVLFAAAAIRVPVKGIAGSARESIEAFTGFLFWLLSLVVLLLVFPIWSNPGAVLLLLVLSLIFALGYARFGIGLNPRWAASRNAVIFVGAIVMTITTAAVPELKTIVKERLISLGEALGETIAEPKKIEYSLANIDELKFFNPVNGKPKIFYVRLKDGSHVLYDGNGFSPDTRERFQPATPDLKQKIKEYLEAKAKEKEEARLKEKTRLEEKARLARLKEERKLKEKARLEKKNSFQPPAPLIPGVEAPGGLVTSVTDGGQSFGIKGESKFDPDPPDENVKQVLNDNDEPPPQKLNQTGVLVSSADLTVRFEKLGIDRNRAGDEFTAYLENDLVVDNALVLKRDTEIIGQVLEVLVSSLLERKGTITLRLTSIQIDPKPVPITTKSVKINPDLENVVTFRILTKNLILGAIQ